MSLGISEEHAELHATARRWVESNATLPVTRATVEADDEELPAFWDDLVSLGWLGLAVEEQYGGDGYGLAEVAVLLEELGRSVAPGPFLPTQLAMAVIGSFGSDAVKGRFLPRLASGELIGAVGVGAEPLGTKIDGDGLTVRGECSPVLGAATASLLVLPARTNGGVVWVVLDRDQAKVTELPSVDATRRLATVKLKPTSVPTDRQIGPLPDPHGIADVAAVLLAAESTGAMSWCVDAAAEYAADRVQFGRPIGQFQAVKHRCADMLLALEQSRACAWDAARGGDPKEATLAAAVAGALVPPAAFQTAKDCIQVHGGIGFTWEHDAHLFLRRATATMLLLGSEAGWNARVAALAGQGIRRTLTFDLPPEADGYRAEVAAFVDDLKSKPSAEWNALFAESGYLVPFWPKPWGLQADPLHQLVIDEQFSSAGLRRPHLAVGMWVLPTLISHGSQEQQERFIGPTMRSEITWCQLFSEPGAGSDLASLSTIAERTDGGWLLTGQKVWTTLAHQAQWGICLARTNPEAPKHDGITCFLIDMSSDGLDIRPLRELTGDEMFNEVFLEQVFVPDDCVVGGVDNGWQAARTTLANERVSMGSGSSFGPGVESVLAMVKADERLSSDAVVLDEIGHLVAVGEAVAVMAMRMTMRALGGHDAGAESSVKKLLGVEHEQEVQEAGLRLLGSAGAVNADDGAVWIRGFLGNRALSIAGGTSEVQRNVIAERLLGLPKDP